MNTLSTGVLLGAVTWLGRRYIDRRIESFFRERERIADAQIRIAERYEIQRLDVATEAIPVIQEIIYRSRNLVREIEQTQNADLVEDLARCWTQLGDSLFKYQLFLAEESFESVHRYKGILQNLVLALVATMPSIDVGGVSPARLSQGAVIVAQRHYPMVDRLYKEILAEFRETLRRRGVVLG